MLDYFAQHARRGFTRPFYRDLCSALTELDVACPGISTELIHRLSAISGHGEPQFDQLLQVLAEIHVLRGVAERAAAHGFEFNHEPGNAGSKNPECEVAIGSDWLAIEVKCPSLTKFRRQRAAASEQLLARLPKPFVKPGTLRPRDNPVKDFLLSSDDKFREYSEYRADARHVLAVVWDDFIQEPVSALLNPGSGLLTPSSFAKDENREPLTFRHVDAVLLIRHLHELSAATREEPFVGAMSTFDYHGIAFPPKVLIPCPGGRPLAVEMAQCLGAVPLEAVEHFAEYRSPDLIWWIDSDAPEGSRDEN
ncbi:MAG: hypothetical protein AAFS11_07630 [Planctomycetota bacterium]